MKIAIASGKGGTGKTTIAVNLALAAGAVQLLDCDVEDPDAAIFLQPRDPAVAPVEVNVPRVDLDKCNFCKACAEFCRFNALIVLENHWLSVPQLCKDCGGCYRVCPSNALETEPRRIGVLERGMLENGLEIVTGRLDPGEAMPSPLIRRVKAEMSSAQSVIVDCPPGSACSMMSAVEGADCCLMVTEPTPFGLHDLKQAVSVVRLMNLPIGVVLNRADLGDAPVRKYCRDKGLPLLLEIPFDDALAQAYAQGVPAVRSNGKWRAVFETLWKDVNDLARTGKGSV